MSAEIPPSSFRPTATSEILQQRANIVRQVRKFFDDRDFLEVETPLLSADVVVDQHLDPLVVTMFDDPRRPDVGRRMWLQTSPEFGMKRLLAAGCTAIYQITKSFRGGEQGRLHNPEFTMLEWYRAGDGYLQGMRLLADLAQDVLGAPSVERLSYRAAFQRFLGLDPHRADLAELGAAAQQRGLQFGGTPPSDRDGWLNLLLAECVEPELGQTAPTILFDYPASQSALARVRAESPSVAERFELYVRGIELANGYHELLDPQILLERNAANNQIRAAGGRPLLPAESRLLEAMRSGLPACSGVALGLDRLVMVALGRSTLAEVMAFPIDRA